MIDALPLLLGPEGYQISRSVRLRSSASAYLNRTPASTTNRRTFTWSGWVKRGALADGVLITASNGSQYVYFAFSSNAITFQINTGTNYIYTTTAVFRDPSAWYHVVLAIDTTQALDANRVQIYVNGVTQARTAGGVPQNTDTNVNVSGVPSQIGSNAGVNNFLDGYLTEINFIDGQALTPSSFGETNPVTGVWQPKRYTGTYGTNGFYLNFSDPSAATAAAIGADRSGNGNNWTPNNITLSPTTSTSYDSMLDVPTPWGDGGNGRGNYAVLNPLQNAGTYSNGNLQVLTTNAGSPAVTIASMGVTSGKWYWELTPTTIGIGAQTGVVNSSANMGTAVGNDANGWGYYSANGNKINNGSVTAYGATYTSNDVIGVALDADAGTLTFYKNGTSQGQAFSGLSGTLFPAFSDAGTGTSTQVANFGQRPFSYTPPSGFRALNTQNLP